MELLEPLAMISSTDQDLSWLSPKQQPQKPLLQEVLVLIQHALRLELEQKLVRTSGDLVGSSREREKKPDNPGEAILRAKRLLKMEGSRAGTRENSFLENCLYTRHFQSGLQLHMAGIILFPKLREIN